MSSPSAQSGFTIIEALVAIILVSVLMVAIAPVIALSVATRVQARRVEQATQAARTYIDGVRSKQIDTPKARTRPPLVEVDDRSQPGSKQFAPKRDLFAQQFDVPPANLPNCKPNARNYPYCLDNQQLSLYCIDLDGGNSTALSDPKSGCTSSSSKDLIVQAFRSTSSFNDDGSKGYLLAVRVYRANAFDGVGSLQRIYDANPEQGTATRSELNRTYAGGSGNRYAPLVEMTTEVRGTSSNNFRELCKRLGGACSN